MDLTQFRLKMNPSLVHVYANIIKRTFQRLVIRNRTHDGMKVAGPPSPECTTLYGEQLVCIPRSCVFNMWHHGWLYWFDIRELVQYMFNSIDGNINNPYNAKPFTRYQKYYILRAFYRSVECSDYVPLEATSLKHIYTSPQSMIDGISSELSLPFLKSCPPERLYDLVHQLTVYYSETKTYYQLLNWIHYHYCQGNELLFRYNICELIKDLFNSSTDQDGFRMMLVQRVNHGRLGDPLALPDFQIVLPMTGGGGGGGGGLFGMLGMLGMMIGAGGNAEPPLTPPPPTPVDPIDALLDNDEPFWEQNSNGETSSNGEIDYPSTPESQ